MFLYKKNYSISDTFLLLHELFSIRERKILKVTQVTQRDLISFPKRLNVVNKT